MPDGTILMAKTAATHVPHSDRLVLGVITAAHGVRGLVRVKSFTEVPEDLVAYGVLTDAATGRDVNLELKGTVKGQLLAQIDGIADRNAAAALKGVELTVARGQLPDVNGDFYVADLIGLAARDETGAALGRVVAVHDFGAGDVLEIAPDGVKPGAPETIYVPFTEDAVPTVDLDARIVEVAALEVVEPEGTNATPEKGGAS